MSDCLFCKLRDGVIPAAKVYEDDHVFAFRDTKPVAPTHLLVVPKRHIATMNDLTPADTEVAGRMMVAAREIAAQAGLSDAGWRAVLNTNAAAGQTVFHIHLHVLGGRSFDWPPG